MPKPVLVLLAHLHAALLFLSAGGAAVYDVTRYGARPDGVTDSTVPRYAHISLTRLIDRSSIYGC
jgi:polygalacturonase